jgi:hypothetical protein
MVPVLRLTEMRERPREVPGLGIGKNAGTRQCVTLSAGTSCTELSVFFSHWHSIVENEASPVYQHSSCN